MESFAGKVVRKDLAFLVKGNLPVPTYVLEYLLGQYCASDDEEIIAEGLEKVKSVIQNNYVHRAAAESVKGLIRESGRHRIIDKVNVTLNEREDAYHASFANLGLNGIPIGTEYVKRNPKLLSGNGVWSIITLGYISGEDIKVRWEIQSFKPIQISRVDVEDYVDQRKNFTTEEWIDFMVHTVGLNPEILNRREKFIVLSRLLPHVENNFNFMELGPKGTGKSHVFQELSPFGVLVSGGDVTSARLFVKMSGNKELLGLVGFWDVVAWDEFEQQPGRAVDAVLIDTMQNYLANKSFNRGKATHEATASMCFVGNTKHTVPYMLKNAHLFESIPNSFIKGAFLDRIHLYNPGWEVKILKKESFSKDYGLITDYIAAILHELRNIDYSSKLKEYANFSKSLSERDHNAIRKTFSGMIKLLYPDGVFTEQEAYEIINFAAESRKRVKDQLYIIDDTFRAAGVAKFEYIKPNGEEVKVETLERLANPEFVEEEPKDEGNPTTPQEGGENGNGPAESAKPAVKLVPKNIEVRENQTGINYKKLFGDYVKSAKHICIIDPYIRYDYQIDNLIDFIKMVIIVSDNPDDLSFEVHTYESDDKLPDLIDKMNDLHDDLETLGIGFSCAYDADHDRKIVLDNGWKISMSRGLDIFEKAISRFTLTHHDQSLRRCKEFELHYVKLD